MTCPACAGAGPFSPRERHTDPYSGASYVLFACPACGLVFSDPMKSLGAGWYRQAAAGWAAGNAGDPARSWRALWLRGLFPEGGGGRKLLDVGCGDGFFMAGAASAGFAVQGLDFDSERTGDAEARGLDGVFTGTPEEFAAARPGEKFSVAAMFQVLEHAEDPAGLLAWAAARLEPGGLLLLDVPNAGRLFAGTLALIDYPPHHLTRWTRTALLAALKRAGFRAERDESVMKLGNFYGHLFSWLTVNLSALLKKLRYGGTVAEMRLKPMELAGSAPPAGAPRRALLVAAARVLFYCVFWLPLLPLAAAVTAYCRRNGRGMFLAVTARREAP